MNEKQELTFTDSVKLDNKNGNNTETTDKNGNGGGGKRSLLSHSVSIIVEPVFDEESDCEPSALSSTENLSTSGQQSPVLLLDDFDVFEMESQRKTRQEEDIVQSIIATAKLRKEEFARLLEEHAEIVNEINRVETSFL